MSRYSSETSIKYSASEDPVVAYRKSLKEQLEALGALIKSYIGGYAE